jgi:hypothetical protein
MTKYLFLLFFGGLFFSCSTSKKAASMDPESYVKWCSSPEFSWKDRDTLNGISYSVRFVPKEYDIAKCALKHCENKETLLTDLNSKNNSYSFILDLSCLEFSKDIFSYPSRTGMSAADRKIYLNNAIKGDIVGISKSNDTIKCISAMYEASIPIRARVLFELESTEKTITKIILKDRMINNSLFEFSMPELTKNNVPTLNLKNYE